MIPPARAWRLSFRARLTAWYAGTLALLLVVFSLQVYWLALEGLVLALDETLDQDLRTLTWAADDPEERLAGLESGGALTHFAVFAPDASRVYRSVAWRGAADLDDAVARADQGTFVTNRFDNEYRVRSTRLANGWVVASARAANDVRLARSSLFLTLAIGLPSTLAFAVLGGWLLAGRALKPVGAMARKAREITADRLDERLPVENARDEFGELALVFNETLARLEGSFTELRRFTADASHQLRTPLAAIRSVGEAGQARAQTAEEARAVVADMLEETRHLAQLVDQLLQLARAEGGQVTLKRTPMDIAQLTAQVVELLEVLGEERGVALRLETSGRVMARIDGDVLRQALVNLIDNAIKFSPPGTTVRVVLETQRDAVARVSVIDQGPGIAPENHQRIFERFHRAPSTDGVVRPGAGLGLSVAMWAVRLHGGRIEVASEPGHGARFTIVLPLNDADG